MTADGHLPALTGQSIREMEIIYFRYGFEWPVSGDDTSLSSPCSGPHTPSTRSTAKWKANQ